jgi:hypothetical protein
MVATTPAEVATRGGKEEGKMLNVHYPLLCINENSLPQPRNPELVSGSYRGWP